MKVLVFDTETTGLPKDRYASINDLEMWPHIVQLSYILYDTDSQKMLSCKDHIIKIDPSVDITEGSIAIHGITRTICQRKGIPISDALAEFNKFLREADRIVGHNVSFDKKMVMVENKRNKIPHYFSLMGVHKSECCTMKHFTEKCAIEVINKNTGKSYHKYPTLTELHNHFFKFKPKSTHDAMADVLICLRCYVYGIHQQDITKEGCASTKELYGLYCL